MYFLLFLFLSPCFSYIPSDLKIPPNSSFIMDPDNLIEKYVLNINNKIVYVKNVQIGVLIINEISKEYKTSLFGDDDIRAEKFAIEIFDFWGIGDRDKQNGILIFISKLNKKYRIITGEGAMKLLNNDECVRIFEGVKRYLAADDFSGAIFQSIKMIDNKINSQDLKDSAFVILMLVIIIGLALSPYFIWCIYKYILKCQQKRSLEKDLNKLLTLEGEGQLNRNFLSNNCVICLGEFNSNVDPQQKKFLDTKVISRCGHNFHRQCLNDWLAIQNLCPICKQKDPLNPDLELLEPAYMKSKERACNYTTHRFSSDLIEEDMKSEKKTDTNFDSIMFYLDLVEIQKARYPTVSNGDTINNNNNNHHYDGTHFTFETHKHNATYDIPFLGFLGGGSSKGGGGGGGSW